MTRQELLRAVEMRMDGMTFEEIAKEMHYNQSTVYSTVRNRIFGSNRSRKLNDRVIFPCIREYLHENMMTISELFKQAFQTRDDTAAYYYDMLLGRKRVSEYVRRKVSALIGKPVDEVFRKDDDNG